MRSASRNCLAIVCIAAAMAVFPGCKTGAGSKPPASPPPPRAEARPVSANMRFSFKLFSELRREQPGKDVFVSPTSVARALAMVYNGAAGETAQAMAKTLELDGLSLDQVNQAQLALRTGLESPDAEVRLTIANSLWARQGIAFNPDFFALGARFYDASIASMDLGSANSAAIINDWVTRKTGNMIHEIVAPGDLAGLFMLLVNAVYFEGRWTDVFNRAETKDGRFTLASGGRKTLPMMSRYGEYDYFDTPDFQAILLPYGRRERFSFRVFLPAKRSSLEKLWEGLTAEKWSEWMRSLRPRQGRIVLPRFWVGYDAKLNGALSALGMGVAFDPQRADFSRMTHSAWLDQVKHKTLLLVYEEGSRAAAVAGVGAAGGAPAGSREKPFEMIVNRPFLCAIWDSQTETPLFLGAIADPGTVSGEM